jgi:hypothetical protein
MHMAGGGMHGGGCTCILCIPLGTPLPTGNTFSVVYPDQIGSRTASAPKYGRSLIDPHRCCSAKSPDQFESRTSSALRYGLSLIDPAQRRVPVGARTKIRQAGARTLCYATPPIGKHFPLPHNYAAPPFRYATSPCCSAHSA